MLETIARRRPLVVIFDDIHWAEQIFLDLSVGRASALTVVFFVLLLAVAGLQLRAWRMRGQP